MLTTCPNCLHVFDHGVHSAAAATFAVPSSCCASRPMLLSATLQIPATSVPTTCTVEVSTVSHPRVIAGMAGGGIVDRSFFAPQQQENLTFQQAIVSGVPQASPSTPLSFVLPTPGINSSPPQASNMMSFHLMPQQSIPPAPWLMNTMHHPAPPSRQPVIPQVPQSETDLVRLAATLNALRTSGWYYEGLSWQESQEVLQSTAPGTFLVRDSSDPRFLFSLSVQTEKGPTSIRLHYVMGQFRLDAEPRLAPMMPLFECVVKLVEYYIALTKDNLNTSKINSRKMSRGDKEQVWVDALGHLYSHILLTKPLYKKNQLPTLMHLSRLSINKQMTKTPSGKQGISQLHLPARMVDYLKEYPYSH